MNFFLKNLISELKIIKKPLFVSLFLYLPITLLSISQPVIIGHAIHEVSLNQIEKSYNYVIFFFIALFLLVTLEIIQGFYLQKAGQVLVSNLRSKAFARIQRLPMSFIDNMQLGKLLTRLSNDAESVAELFSMGAVQIVADVLFLLATIILLMITDFKLSLYSFLTLPVLLLGLVIFRHFIRLSFMASKSALAELNAYLAEYLSGNSTIQMYNSLDKSLSLFGYHSNKYIKTHKKSVFLDASIYSFVDAISYITFAFVLWGAFGLKQANALQISVLIAFIEALTRFYGPIRDFSNRYSIFENSSISLKRIFEVMNWPIEEDTQEYKNFKGFNKKIEFKNVSFAYKENNLVIDNVSFTVNKNEKCALVGYSGAGKSSIIKLINRFYPVNSGEILIDDINIKDLSLKQLRNLMSIVPQQIFLFKASVRDNLCFGNLNATDEEIWHALRLVQLHDVILNRGGLSSMVSTMGENFSYGERQLLAFARTIIVNPPIIILDEATANVDQYTESRLKIAIKNLFSNRTAIIIAHRFSTIKDSDKILFFENGKIIAQGTHNELMKSSQEYKSMIYLQEKEESLLKPF